MLTQIFLSLLFRSLSETKYFHLLFIVGLTCTLSFSCCFAHADFSLLLSNSGESYCQIKFKKLFDNNND